jgi:hypothetical protein
MMVRFHHIVLEHTGETRVYDSIRKAFYHPQLKSTVNAYECAICQRHKLQGAGYGELPPRQVSMMPWEEVHIDLLGPWAVNIDGGIIEFNALTCIDHVTITNLVELVLV